MEPGVKAGAPVQLIRRSFSPALQMQGTALTGMTPVLAVRLQSPWPGQPGEEVALIAGEPGARFVSLGRLLQARANVASFEVVAPWKPLDLRATPRYPTRIAVEVRSVLGQSRQPGTIIDISLGGMAVEVATKPGGREVAIVTRLAAYSATLPCEIVGTSRGQDSTTLHLKFGELTAAQRAFVRNLVAVGQAQLLQAEREAS